MGFYRIDYRLKSHGINSGLQFMDNGASESLRMVMATMYRKYQLVPPINHKADNEEISIQTFQKNFIVILCSVDKEFHLQLWEKLLKQAKISLNRLRQSRINPHLSDSA